MAQAGASRTCSCHMQAVMVCGNDASYLCCAPLQDVENMLEAYSLQLDYYMAQLGDLSEFIEDFQVYPAVACVLDAILPLTTASCWTRC